jgi:hypothetical protein
MAPLGPLPAMVGNESETKPGCLALNSSDFAATSHSVTLPARGQQFSQPRTRPGKTDNHSHARPARSSDSILIRPSGHTMTQVRGQRLKGECFQVRTRPASSQQQHHPECDSSACPPVPRRSSTLSTTQSDHSFPTPCQMGTTAVTLSLSRTSTQKTQHKLANLVHSPAGRQRIQPHLLHCRAAGEVG